MITPEMDPLERTDPPEKAAISVPRTSGFAHRGGPAKSRRGAPRTPRLVTRRWKLRLSVCRLQSTPSRLLDGNRLLALEAHEILEEDHTVSVVIEDSVAAIQRIELDIEGLVLLAFQDTSGRCGSIDAPVGAAGRIELTLPSRGVATGDHAARIRRRGARLDGNQVDGANRDGSQIDHAEGHPHQRRVEAQRVAVRLDDVDRPLGVCRSGEETNAQNHGNQGKYA